MSTTTSRQRERHFVADVKEHREHNAACVLFAWPMNASRRMTFGTSLAPPAHPHGSEPALYCYRWYLIPLTPCLDSLTVRRGCCATRYRASSVNGVCQHHFLCLGHKAVDCLHPAQRIAGLKGSTPCCAILSVTICSTSSSAC